MTMFRTYVELEKLNTFEERFQYLMLKGEVGKSTFGFDRYLNQKFYGSKQWRDVRHFVIARDGGCDLGVDGREIHHKIYIHHMNPMTVEDIWGADESILDPNNLITTTHRTHNAIHYGDESLIEKAYVPRAPNDTKLW